MSAAHCRRSTFALRAASSDCSLCCCSVCFVSQERVSHLNTMPDQVVDAHRAATGSPANGSPLAGPNDSPRYAMDHTVAAAASHPSEGNGSNGSGGQERQRQRAERNSAAASAAAATTSALSSGSSSKSSSRARRNRAPPLATEASPPLPPLPLPPLQPS